MEDDAINIVIECPHCKEPILIEKLNCCIFRHGVLKTDGTQINPHARKELCDYYINDGLIFGCGKPFKIISNNDTYVAIICDYI
jgi:hypothetical protein